MSIVLRFDRAIEVKVCVDAHDKTIGCFSASAAEEIQSLNIVIRPISMVIPLVVCG